MQSASGSGDDHFLELFDYELAVVHDGDRRTAFHDIEY